MIITIFNNNSIWNIAFYSYFCSKITITNKIL